MYEAATFEKKTCTPSQDFYATKNKFHSSTRVATMNHVAAVTKFSALHLLVYSVVL
jgi:hypothetical protein